MGAALQLRKPVAHSLRKERSMAVAVDHDPKRSLQAWQHWISPLGWWRYGCLLFRTLQAAWWVERTLRGAGVSPGIERAIRAVERAYLPPQPGWNGVAPDEVRRLAARLVRLPRRWGRCLQESLITYRILNGYGVPVTLCLGLSRERPSEVGHAWVDLEGAPPRSGSPSEMGAYRVVYRSPRQPASPLTSRRGD
jgi:hypothetical protein